MALQLGARENADVPESLKKHYYLMSPVEMTLIGTGHLRIATASEALKHLPGREAVL